MDIWLLMPAIACAVCTAIRLAALTFAFLRTLAGSRPADRVELFASFTAAVGGSRSPRRRRGVS